MNVEKNEELNSKEEEKIIENNNTIQNNNDQKDSLEDVDDSLMMTDVEMTTVEPQGEKLNKKWYQNIKTPSSMAIVLGIILVIMFLTWVVPHQTYAQWHPEDYSPDGTIDPGALPWYGDSPFGLGFMGPGWYISDTGKYGILDLPMIIFAGFLDAGGVVIFVIAIGMFLEVMMASKTLEVGVLSLEHRLKGKELLIIPFLFVLFSLGGTAYGMQEETIGFFPIIIPFLILVGFDALTGFLVIVIGTTVGITTSIVDPFSVGVFSAAVPDNNMGVDVSIATGITYRIILWVIFTAIGASIITFYAARVKKNKDNSYFAENYEKDLIWARDKYGLIEGEEKERQSLSRRQVIAFVIFSLTFFIMIFSMLPWEQWNVEMNIWLSWIFFGNFILGDWFYLQLIILFVMSTVLLGIVFGMKTKDLTKTMGDGAKAMLGVAMIIGVARGIGIILIYSGMNDSLINSLLNTKIADTSGVLFVTLMFPIFLILALFIASTSGLASATAPIVGGTVIQLSNGDPAVYTAMIGGVMLAYAMGEGIANMFTPTNAVIFAQAEGSNMEYGQVIKPLLYFAGLYSVLCLISLPLIMFIIMP